jgi:hypothetical protein
MSRFEVLLARALTDKTWMSVPVTVVASVQKGKTQRQRSNIRYLVMECCRVTACLLQGKSKVVSWAAFDCSLSFFKRLPAWREKHMHRIHDLKHDCDL